MHINKAEEMIVLQITRKRSGEIRVCKIFTFLTGAILHTRKNRLHIAAAIDHLHGLLLLLLFIAYIIIYYYYYYYF